MPFQVELMPLVNRQIASWRLSDYLFVEVHLRLQRELSQNPAQILIRTRQPFDGMSYLFSIIDPENRFREFVFVFQVLYSQDEERLIISRSGCRWQEGW